MGKLAIFDFHGKELASVNFLSEMNDPIIHHGEANKIHVYPRARFYCCGEMMTVAHIHINCPHCGNELIFRARVDCEHSTEIRLSGSCYHPSGCLCCCCWC